MSTMNQCLFLVHGQAAVTPGSHLTPRNVEPVSSLEPRHAALLRALLKKHTRNPSVPGGTHKRSPREANTAK
jgi:hypothetical protein